MIGEDVRVVKDRLVDLRYLAKSTHSLYGDATYKAVKAFQSANNLEADGIVGILTWTQLFADQPSPSVEVPSWIAEPARTEIAHALSQVSAKRRSICLEALRWCVDRNAGPDLLKGFYVRGANLYDKNLSVHTMTAARLESYFRRAEYAPYYDAGREEMMRKMAVESGYSIVGADCSGFIVGLWRHAEVVSSGFDATADHLYGSYCIEVSSPQAGDLAHKSGHIGICVSPNWIVESAGGAYGIQLTKRTDRRCLDFRTMKTTKLGKWSNFGDPKVY